MEFLKEFFAAGPLTFEQLKKALEDKAIKVANLTSGEYVAKAKYDTDIAKAKADKQAADEQLQAANDTIAKFEGMDIEGVKKSAEEWKAKAEQFQAANEKQAYAFKVRALVAAEKFTSNAARKQFEKDLIEKDFKFDGATLLGYNDFKEEYAKADPTAFAAADEGADGKTKAQFGGKSGQQGGKAMTYDDFNKLTTTEKMKVKEENPTLFSQFMKRIR